MYPYVVYLYIYSVQYCTNLLDYYISYMYEIYLLLGVVTRR